VIRVLPGIWAVPAGGLLVVRRRGRLPRTAPSRRGQGPGFRIKSFRFRGRNRGDRRGPKSRIRSFSEFSARARSSRRRRSAPPRSSRPPSSAARDPAARSSRSSASAASSTSGSPAP
jgi:hypothetical protein